jgi:uncharacterized membrane protein YhaH (DUF805 family)
MVEYFKLALSKYAEFTGRSRRSEYWYFILVYTLISSAVNTFAFILGDWVTMLGSLVGFALFIPSLAVSIRRLHDTGRSGWWLLIGVVPLIGIILLIVWFATDSQPGANEYGPNCPLKVGFVVDAVAEGVIQ